MVARTNTSVFLAHFFVLMNYERISELSSFAPRILFFFFFFVIVVEALTLILANAKESI